MRLRLITEVNENDLINITTEWIAEKYDLMNQQLFEGKLGHCDFGIFTTGRGMLGGVLGWFKMTGRDLKYSKQSRRMFIYDPYWGDKTYIDYDNFAQLCKPRIELNGNYRWTEKAALSTLVHEMCHYYNHMYGWVPRQSHGTEFRDIAYVVSSRSNGIFTVERVASAEQMNEMELNPEMQQKRDARKENKINRIIPTFLYMQNGSIRLVNCNSENLVRQIVTTFTNGVREIKISHDRRLVEFLFNNRYGRAMTTYRYWNVENEPWINSLGEYNMKTVYTDSKNTELTPSIATSQSNQQTIQPVQAKEPVIKHFKIQLSQGGMFELFNVTEEQLKEGLRERFPKWSEQIIEKIANDPKYRK